MLLDDAVNDHDERAGRSGDLHAGPTKCRHDEAADNGRVKAVLRRDATGDRESDGERDGDDADDDAGEDVSAELTGVVILKGGKKLGLQRHIT